MFVLQSAPAALFLSAMAESGGLFELLLYWTVILIALLLALVIVALIVRKFVKNRRPGLALDTRFLEGIRDNLSPDEMRRVREATLRKLAEQEKKKEDALSIEDLKSIAEGKKSLPRSPDKAAVPAAAPGKSAPGKPAAGKAGGAQAGGVKPAGQAEGQKKEATPQAPESNAMRISSGKVQYYADLGEVGEKKIVTSLEDILVSRRKAEQKTPPAERIVPPQAEAAQKMKPIDVELLLERGLITDQEFERLQGYFHKEEEKE